MKSNLGNYLRPAKKLFAYSAIYLAACLIAGIFAPPVLREQMMNLLKNHYSTVTYSFGGIYLNNLAVAAVLTFGGFLFGLPTVLIGGLNFFLIGAGASEALSAGALNLFVLSIAPHGMFEIPAVYFSFVLGISLAAAVFRRRDYFEGFKTGEAVKYAAVLFAAGVVPVLAVAALFEVTVTVAVMRSVGALPGGVVP